MYFPGRVNFQTIGSRLGSQPAPTPPRNAAIGLECTISIMLRATWIASSLLFAVHLGAQTGGVRLWAVSDVFASTP